MLKNLIVIADWVGDSLAKQEFENALSGAIVQQGNPHISFVSSTQNTIHGGFLLSQITQTIERKGSAEETVIFINVNPRINGIPPDGADGLIAIFQTKLVAIGPNNGNNFSLIKSKILQTFTYPGGIRKGQFSSRDAYPPILARFMESHENELELTEVNMGKVPDLKNHYIGHIDNFGNIKTTIPKSALKGHGNPVKTITINNIAKQARLSNHIFSGQVNELIIAPGSSGPPDDPFLEIVTKMSSAAKLFNNPLPGSQVIIL